MSWGGVKRPGASRRRGAAFALGLGLGLVAAATGCTFGSTGGGGGSPDPTEGPTGTGTGVVATGEMTTMADTGAGTDATDAEGTDSGGCAPGTVGCSCAPGCRPGLECVDEVCVSATCSDGTLDPGESCDDGNQVGGDGCEADCSVSEGIAEVHAGQTHTCARVWEGTFKCWGEAADGRLGYGNGTNGAANVGDDETPSTVSTIELGEPVRQLCTGDAHSCAVLESGAVRCWGRGANGRLGNAQNQSFGDGEPAIESPLVDLGGDAVMVACGGLHSCAVRADGAVLCWGESDNGRLGLGPGTQDVGDDEAVSSVGPVDVGGATVQLALGLAHSCARLETGVVRCWGTGARGRLGYGDTNDVGANETPSTAGNVPLGEAAVEIVAGAQHTCARLQSGLVKCWGANDSGQLGDGTTDDRGDERMEVPSMLPPVVTGDAVVALAAGDAHTCAVLANGNVTCWGEGGSGQLASEDTNDRLQPDPLGVAVDPQRAATAVTAGGSHTCARVTDGSVRCWGAAAVGQLGYGTTDALGDDPGETPDLLGPVPL